MLAPFFAGIAAASNLDGAATLPMHGVYPPAYVHFHSLNQIKLYFQHIVVVLPRQHGAADFGSQPGSCPQQQNPSQTILVQLRCGLKSKDSAFT